MASSPDPDISFDIQRTHGSAHEESLLRENDINECRPIFRRECRGDQPIITGIVHESTPYTGSVETRDASNNNRHAAQQNAPFTKDTPVTYQNDSDLGTATMFHTPTCHHHTTCTLNQTITKALAPLSLTRHTLRTALNWVGGTCELKCWCFPPVYVALPERITCLSQNRNAAITAYCPRDLTIDLALQENINICGERREHFVASTWYTSARTKSIQWIWSPLTRAVSVTPTVQADPQWHEMQMHWP